MEQHKIDITTSATFYTSGNPKTAKHIVIALHGYGQLSQYFIRKFSELSDDYFVIVPEGLHRFYLQGTSGRVGASWMTKEKREDDIKDYINYLNKLWLNIKSQHNFQSRILLGFSQGGSTAARWHQLGNFKATKFILWAGVFPPDMTQNWEGRFHESLNYFVVGDQDPYYNHEKIMLQSQYFAKKSVNFTLATFIGKHDIHTTKLLELCP